MSLESKSIHELRGIAQAIGVKVDWAWNRHKLVQKIEVKTRPPSKPIPKISAMPTSGDQESLIKALRFYSGLVITFPDESTWQMNYSNKEDSGTMHMPAYAIMDCARRLCE